MGLWTIGYNGAGQFALGYASIDQAIAKVGVEAPNFDRRVLTFFQSDSTQVYCAGSPTLKWTVWNPHINLMVDVGTCDSRWCVSAADATTKVAIG